MVAGGEGSTDQEGREDSHQEGTKSVVVGIGASAGGIRALQEFFHAVPHRLGATFVVIVHLDPSHPSQLEIG